MRLRTTPLAIMLAVAFASGPAAADLAATRPAPDPARLFRFLAIGDPQYSTEERFTRWGDQLVAAEALKPDFAIALGDLTSAGRPAEFEWYKAAIARPAYPVHSLPGNHDDNYGNDAKNYLAALGPKAHSFDHGGYHVVCFDSQKGDSAWLRDDLAANAGKPIIFAQHYAPSEKLLAQLKANGCVLALSGHVHASRRGEREGLFAINVAPAGAGFLVVDVMRDGSIRATWRPAGEPGAVRLIHPTPDSPVPPGPVQLLADAYGTNDEVARVECDAGAGWAPMRQCGWRSWTAEADMTDSRPIRVRAMTKTGTQWETTGGVVMGAPIPAVKADTPWPMWGRSSLNDRQAPSALRPPLRLAWWTPLGGEVRDCTPVVGDGRVYVTACEQGAFAGHALVCLDAAGGRILWRRALPASVVGSAAVCRDVVAVATLLGRTYAFDAKTGEPRWTGPAPMMYNTGGNYGRVTADDRAFYVGNLAALDAASGEVLWQAPHAQYPRGTPAIGNGLIVGYGYYSTAIRRLDDREILWRQSSTYGPSIILGDEVIYSRTGRVRPKDQAVVWQNPLLYSGGCLAGDRVIVVNRGSQPAAVDLADGKTLWQWRSSKTFRAAFPAAAGDYAFFAANDRRLHAVRTADGKDFSGPAVPWPASDAAVSGNALFLTGADGNVFCLVGE